MDAMSRDVNQLSERHRDVLLSPIFIVGAGRSGTTWLQRLLLELPEVIGGQESTFFYMFNQAFSAVEDNQSDVRKVGLSSYWLENEFDEAMREIWLKTFMPMFAQKPGATVLLEKTPGNALYMDRIARFLPQARFIHLIRDSRAVTASLIAAGKGWGSNWAPGNTKSAALEWWRMVTAARDAGVARDPQRYMEIHYEDLHSDAVAELGRLVSFIGLPASSAELQAAVDAQQFKKQQKSAGTGLVDARGNEIKEPKGFFRKGQVDSWQSDLNFFQKLVTWRYTRKLMQECGYGWSGRLR